MAKNNNLVKRGKEEYKKGKQKMKTREKKGGTEIRGKFIFF